MDDTDEFNRQLAQQVWQSNNVNIITVPFIKWTVLRPDGKEINYAVTNTNDFFKDTFGVVVDSWSNANGSVDIIVEVMPS